MSNFRGCAAAILLLLPGLPSMAQTAGEPVAASYSSATGSKASSFDTPRGPGRTLVFSAMLGVQSDPAYFGSDETIVGPSFRGGIAYFNFAGIGFGDTEASADPYERDSGFGYGLSFRYVGPRDLGEYDEIDGLDDIDPTLEMGGAVGYVWPNFEVLVDARYGFGGSQAWVGGVRANYVVRPTN